MEDQPVWWVVLDVHLLVDRVVLLLPHPLREILQHRLGHLRSSVSFCGVDPTATRHAAPPCSADPGGMRPRRPSQRTRHPPDKHPRMDVAVAGGHGKIALRLLRLLAERGDIARGLIRNPEHAPDLEQVGAMPVGADLENLDAEQLARNIAGVDAVVFAAGAGPGSGPARKRTVDYGAAVKLIEACEDRGVPRYLMVSSIGAHDPKSVPEQMRPYLEAKADADRALMASELDWTIIRPGMLTNDPGTGQISATTEMGTRGPIPRDDVAATLAASLNEPNTVNKAFVVISGD